MAQVLFYTVTAGSYATPAAHFEAMIEGGTVTSTSFYHVGEDLYLGSIKISNAADLATAVSNISQNASDIDALETAIAAMDQEVITSGTAGTGQIRATGGTFAGADIEVLTGITQVDGGFTAATSTKMKKLASTGKAEDVAIDDEGNLFTATDVEGALAEIMGSLGTAAAADVATSAIQESSTDDGLVSAAQVATFVGSEIEGLTGAMHFVGVITRQSGETDAQAIARVVTSPEAGDVVVMSDNAKEYVYDGTNWREVGDETEFVKKTATIAGVDLEDNITATELRTALNVSDGAEANVIESVKVNGSALTPSSEAVDILIAEGSTDGTLAVNGSDVAVHGLGSAAYTASTAYEAAGAVTTAIEALDVTDTAVSGQYVSSVSQSDGVITVTRASLPQTGIDWVEV